MQEQIGPIEGEKYRIREGLMAKEEVKRLTAERRKKILKGIKQIDKQLDAAAARMFEMHQNGKLRGPTLGLAEEEILKANFPQVFKIVMRKMAEHPREIAKLFYDIETMERNADQNIDWQELDKVDHFYKLLVELIDGLLDPNDRIHPDIQEKLREIKNKYVLPYLLKHFEDVESEEEK